MSLTLITGATPIIKTPLVADFDTNLAAATPDINAFNVQFTAKK